MFHHPWFLGMEPFEFAFLKKATFAAYPNLDQDGQQMPQIDLFETSFAGSVPAVRRALGFSVCPDRVSPGRGDVQVDRADGRQNRFRGGFCPVKITP